MKEAHRGQYLKAVEKGDRAHTSFKSIGVFIKRVCQANNLDGLNFSEVSDASALLLLAA